MEIAAIRFVEPAVTIAFDSDASQAVSERKKAFADAARGGYLVAGAHLPFPGIGHVRAERGAYVWVPIDYTTAR